MDTYNNNISNYQGRNIKQIENNYKITFFSILMLMITIVAILIYNFITRTL